MADEDKRMNSSSEAETCRAAAGETPAAEVEISDGGAQPSRRRLRLVDLLVLLFIVAVLAALLLPAIRRARISGTAVACRDNLRRIGVAMGLYQVDYPDMYITILDRVPRKSHPEGWGANWYNESEGLFYSLPVQVLAAQGYLETGWRDNRDRVADSVCRCPSDRAARRRIRDPHNFNSCKRAHCAGGLTVSYVHRHEFMYGYMRPWSKHAVKPEKTMLLGEYDWWNHPSRFALQRGVRRDSKHTSGGAFSYRYNNNVHCPTDRHGGVVNILFCDFHVEGRDPFEWHPQWAFSRCDPADKVPPFTSYPTFSDPLFFYEPPGYAL
ncbi:MAG: hypothetical protein ACYTAN_12650 [Planctomycetota bacterium]|jgi:prepilin-type processing-associated H-X9-DG protein